MLSRPQCVNPSSASLVHVWGDHDCHLCACWWPGAVLKIIIIITLSLCLQMAWRCAEDHYNYHSITTAADGLELCWMQKLMCFPPSFLTHWGRVTHICVSKLTIIGSDNGLSPGRRQAIIWTNAGILLIGPLGTNFSEILIAILTFSFKKMHLKVSSAKWRPLCPGLIGLISDFDYNPCVNHMLYYDTRTKILLL